ncbi:MAG: hypothetical protein ACOY40_03295 [Bacillota bacterium]
MNPEMEQMLEILKEHIDDRMAEFAGRVERKIEDVDAALRIEMSDLASRFDRKVDDLENRFDKKVDGLESRFDKKVDDLENRFDRRIEDLGIRFDKKVEDLKEQFERKVEEIKVAVVVENEKTRHDIKAIAEGYQDVHRKTMENSDNIDNLAAAVTKLEWRVRKLESKS